MSKRFKERKLSIAPRDIGVFGRKDLIAFYRAIDEFNSKKHLHLESNRANINSPGKQAHLKQKETSHE